MHDYFDLLEAELRAAVPRAVGTTPARARRRIRLGNGMASAMIGGAVAVAVLLLAVLLLGHAHRAAETAPSGPAARSATLTRNDLLDNFAILRRAQTVADRSWQPGAAAAGVGELPGMTRLARTSPNGDRVFLTVNQFRAPQAGKATNTYSLQVWVVDRSGRTGGANFGPNVGYTIFPFEFPAPDQLARNPAAAQLGLVWTSVVPDGVGSVRWTFACALPKSRCVGRKPITVTVPVRNNVASAAGPPDTGRCAGTALGCLSPSTVTWYSSAGRQVVARYARTSVVTAPPFVLHNPASPRPARLDVLSARGIAGINFGRPRAAVVAALDRLLGVRRINRRSYHGDCGVDQSITWWEQFAASGQPSLTAYFAHDRMVGYQYGNPGDRVVRRLPAHGPILAATRGLTIGDTLERGRRLYGRAFTTSAAQGGSWKVSTAGGLIDGYASTVPRPGDLGASTVLTIDAGNVGCPAVAP